MHIYTHKDCLKHDPGPAHPENAGRLNAIMAALKNTELSMLSTPSKLSKFTDDLTYLPAPLASTEQILLAHSQRHLNTIMASEPVSGSHALDGDTVMSPGSLDSALRGAGAACQAVDDLFAITSSTNSLKTAFCATRPPGHHATADQAMGFCIFNNIAVAALYAQHKHGIERVAIVDFDVHHGNGSQDILSGKNGVLYISTHQSPLYPGSGSVSENISGNILNIPLPANTDHQAYIDIFKDEVLPILNHFTPELILVSAGFDAHLQDPLAGLALTEETYYWLGMQLGKAAMEHCQGRLISILEGGYNQQVLGSSLASYLQGIHQNSVTSS